VNEILVGKSDKEIYLHARYANRHGYRQNRLVGRRGILRGVLGSILNK
jgi:hypothetical protein